MREIKFRAWDKEFEKMTIPYSLNELLKGASALHECFENDYVWMQYTGLKDKTGNEIYEGDIIKHKEWGYTSQTVSVVGYYDGGFDPFSDNQDNCPYPEPSECEVIGNIYENSNLLED